MTRRSPISALAGVRIAVGGTAWAMPNVAPRLFGLDPRANPQASYMTRLFGVRDLALGAGLLATNGESRRVWLQVGIVCDLADAAAAWLGGRNGTLPKFASLLTGSTALIAVGMGVAALASET